MIARVLGQDEWSKVDGMDISPLLRLVRPEDIQIVVVEVEGQIVATMSVLRMTHLEGTWVDPQHRNAGIVRSLLRGAAKAASKWCDGWVVTSANTDEVRGILDRMHANRVEADSYVLGLKES